MNPKQYYGSGIPIGGSANLTYTTSNNNSLYTAPDGSQWYTYTPNSPFDYTSDYSYLPSFMISSGSLLPGPVANLFPGTTTITMAYDPSTNTYCTGAAAGLTATWLYYQSNNDASTWSTLATPTLGSTITHNPIVFTAGKFILGSSATTNGAAYSTDGGLTWTRQNKTATGSVADIISNGANNIIMFGAGSTATSYSTNGGITYASSTLPAAAAPLQGNPGVGWGTWNAGANLFLAMSTTSGYYMTSPTGATWTARNTIATYAKYASYFPSGTKMASDSTTTVAMGLYGFFCTSTDGLTWSNHGFISNSPRGISAAYPDALYYDGTRFVAVFGSQTWYSTNATTWTEGCRIGYCTSFSVSSGVLFGIISSSSFGAKTKIIKVSNVASTSKQTIIGPFSHTIPTGTTRSITRIR